MQGTQIQETVKDFLIKKFENLIEENGLYCIKCKSVDINKGVYPITSHGYHLIFNNGTYVGLTNGIHFPATIFSFKTISEIKDLSHSDQTPLFGKDTFLYTTNIFNH